MFQNTSGALCKTLTSSRVQLQDKVEQWKSSRQRGHQGFTLVQKSFTLGRKRKEVITIYCKVYHSFIHFFEVSNDLIHWPFSICLIFGKYQSIALCSRQDLVISPHSYESLLKKHLRKIRIQKEIRLNRILEEREWSKSYWRKR